MFAMRLVEASGSRALWLTAVLALAAVSMTAVQAYGADDSVETRWRFRYQDAKGNRFNVRRARLRFFDRHPDDGATFREIGSNGPNPPF